MALQEGTKKRALDIARGLVQGSGFNGFSFQHVADLLGIKKPSLYDHFKSKEDLGIKLIEEYNRLFTSWIETIEVFEPKDKISAYFEMIFKFSLDSRKFCPLSAMIADYNTLPSKMRKTLGTAFKIQQDWLIEVIRAGQAQKIFRKDMKPEVLMRLVISTALGSQAIARVSHDPETIREMKKSIFQILSPG